MFSLQELNVFVEAALTRNFSQAARRLYLSQPAVSVQIRNLEQQLGVELFHRKGRSVQLSEAGRILLPLAQQCLLDAKNIQETMDGLKGRLVGELVIACSTTSGKYILPRLVAGFRRKYPEVRVAINVMSRRAALDAVLEGRAETAVVSARTGYADLGYQEFLEDHIVLIVPAGHPWADGRTVCPEDLLTQSFIMREESAAAHEMLAEGLANRGMALEGFNVVLTLANDEAIEMSVEADIGVAFVSRLAAAHGLALNRVVEVPVEGLNFKRPIYIVRHHRRLATPLQKAFWDFALAPENDVIRSIAQTA